MNDLFSKMFSGVIKAGAMAVARHVATLAGTAVLTWLLSHHIGSDFASRLVGDFQDMILTAAGAGLLAAGVGTSLKDVGSVNGKVAVTASAAYDAGRTQGEQDGVGAQVAADTAKVSAVAAAMKAADAATPQDKKAVVAALKAGTF